MSARNSRTKGTSHGSHYIGSRRRFALSVGQILASAKLKNLTGISKNGKSHVAPIYYSPGYGDNHVQRTGRAFTEQLFADPLMCNMRSRRFIVVLIVLFLYVANSVGGRAAHLYLHKHNACCLESTHDRRDNLSAQKTFPFHANCGCHTIHVNDDPQKADNQPVGREGGHTSSGCWICHLLGQAQEQPFKLEAIVLCNVVTRVRAAKSVRVFAARSSEFHSRAPPAMYV